MDSYKFCNDKGGQLPIIKTEEEWMKLLALDQSEETTMNEDKYQYKFGI